MADYEQPNIKVIDFDTHSEFKKAYMREWRKLNKDKIKEYQLKNRNRDYKKRNEWRKSNPDYRGGNRKGYINSKEGWARYKIASIKRSSKQRGIEFNITYKDVLELMVEKCPVCGIRLNYGLLNMKKIMRRDSPSLDRIDNEKGYIKGNIVIVSNLVNRIKSDLSLNELEILCKIKKFYEKFK